MKIPPHNNEAELSVLGAMFINPGCIPKVQKALDPDDFYGERHQYIAQALFNLKGKATL